MPSSSSDSSSDDEQTKKRFQIFHRTGHRVLDVEKGSKSENTKIILYDPKTRRNKNQLWYTDKDGYIRNVLTKMTLYADGANQPMKTSKKYDDPRGRWRIDGNRITNGQGYCLDTINNRVDNGAELCYNVRDNTASQEWDIRYV